MRFVDLGIIDPEAGASYDAAAFRSRNAGLTEDTLLIYTRNRRTVSLGRFRRAEDDILPDIPADVAVVRRMSGGSSILTGPGQIIYSAIIGGTIPDRRDSFGLVCGGVVGTLSDLGIRSEYKPPNDVLVSGMKISGSAQYRNAGCMIQHGTLIIEPDPMMFRILKRRASPGYNGLTSVEEASGRVPDRREIVSAVIKGFSEALGTGIEKGRMTDPEVREAEAFRRNLKDGASDPSDL